MNKNIFYCSNAQQEIFPKNTRTNFHSYIDINHLHYIPDRNLTAAIKSITFDYKLDVIETETDKPHIILIQDVEDESIIVKPHIHSLESENPEFGIGRDYNYELADGNTILSRSHVENPHREFTDIKIHLHHYKKVIHNIFLNKKPIKSATEFINYINKVFDDINFDYLSKLKSLLLIKGGSFVNLYSEHDIYICEKVSDILGFNPLDLSKHPTLSALVWSSGFHEEQLWRAGFDHVNSHTGISYYIKFAEDTEPQHSIFLNKLMNTPGFYSYLYKQKKNIGISWRKVSLNRLKSEVLALRSSLSKSDIVNSHYDKLVTFLDGEKLKYGVCHIEFKNPTFSLTTKEQLSRAHFEIVDVTTKQEPKFSLGTPTFIHIIVSSDSRMTKQFNVFLDSTDGKSKTFHPNNTNMDFTIRLPERLEFNRKWQITLKSVFMPTRYYTIFDDSCWFAVVQCSDEHLQPFREESHYLPALTDYIVIKKILLQNGRYILKTKLSTMIQEAFNNQGLSEIHVSIHDSKFVIELKASSDLVIMISPFLAKILGYSLDDEKPVFIDFHSTIKITASNEPDLKLLTPRNILVLCDIVY